MAQDRGRGPNVTVDGVLVHLRRSARARRLSLRVSAIDGRVTLTLPRRVGQTEALRFVQDRTDWLRDALAGQGAPVIVAPGARLPVEGAERTVTLAAARAPVLQGDRLILPQRAAGRAGATVAAFLRQLARTRLVAACDRHAAALGRQPGRLTLRDTRSRWGSCTAAGDLMFSWRLAMAPPEVLDYVAAHEVAHLVEMNHSPAFWAQVARLYPGWQAQRDWLRREGLTLHRYRFDTQAGD